MNKKKERWIYPDFCKGILIILVVVGHSIQFGLGKQYYNSGLYFANNIYKAIYSFHMPAFMIISGFFWQNKIKSASKSSVLVSRIKKLLQPIFSWSIIVTANIFLFESMSAEKIIKTFTINFVYGLWFMWALIICSILLFTVEKIPCNKIVFVGFLMLLFLLTPDIMNFHLYKFVFPFFIMGGCIATEIKTVLKYCSDKKTLQIMPILFVVWILLLGKYSNQCYIYISGVSLLQKTNALNQIFIDIYRWGVALLACVFAGNACYWILKIKNKAIEKIVSIVSWIGKKSMAVYIVSTTIFNKFVLPKLAWNVNAAIAVILESIMVLVVSLLLEIVTRKSKALSKILWGS